MSHFTWTCIMSKRNLGIPHLAANSQSKKARLRALGIQLPPAASTAAARGTQAPQRKDAPVLRVGVQARTGKAPKPSDLITDIDFAIAEYDKDKYSAGSVGVRRAVENTWRSYHVKAHRLDPANVGPEVFPVTVAGLKSIAALMKLDEYRSFGNYSSWAKGQHIEFGFDWSQQLAHELTQAGRSLSRGLGPARQSAAFSLDRLALLPISATKASGAPLYPKFTILLGSLWVLREIEMAWSRWEDITIDDDSLLVTWTLTASKTDPAAKSCSRKWGCLCSEIGQHVCPFHVMAAYRDLYVEHFGGIVGAAPLFPDSQGNVAQKSALVTALEDLMGSLAEPILDPAGRRRYGGHSCRVSGSRFWASLGMELQKLHIFARWGSDVILRYVSDSPLCQVKLTSTASSSSTSCSPEARVSELGCTVVKLTSFVEEAVAEMQQLKHEISARGSGPVQGDYVQNVDSKCWHFVLLGGAGTHPSQWRTWCGWRFGLQAHSRSTATSAEGATCSRCLRQSGTLACVSSSSSSGSNSGT